MEILLKARQKKMKQKVERDHYWYDHETKKMLHGRGGEMQFRYEEGKSVPYLVDHEGWVNKSDYYDILNWVEKNQNRFQLLDNVPEHLVLIDVPKDEVDDIIDDLIRHNIMYEG